MPWNGARQTINGSAENAICLSLQGPIGKIYSKNSQMGLMTCLATSQSTIAMSAVQDWTGSHNTIGGIVEDARHGNEGVAHV